MQNTSQSLRALCVSLKRQHTKQTNRKKTENMKHIYYNLLFILVTLTSCSNASQPNDPIPEHETFKIQSKQVGEERVINVWIPENYKTSKDALPRSEEHTSELQSRENLVCRL